MYFLPNKFEDIIYYDHSHRNFLQLRQYQPDATNASRKQESLYGKDERGKRAGVYILLTYLSKTKTIFSKYHQSTTIKKALKH